MAARRRYVAPARAAVPPARFDAPIFAGCARQRGWLTDSAWPTVADLDAALDGARHAFTGRRLRFVAQDGALLADGLHYEQRIHVHGAIATREANWHDLFNAIAWIGHGALKAALNLRQAADVARVGPAVRTRGQCALTQFDEAGVLVVLRDAAPLAAWDSHDWPALFGRQGAAWRDGRIELVVFGHALREHALDGGPLPTAKCIAVQAGAFRSLAAIEHRLAAAIAAGDVLGDPQELRPLPLDGVPAWRADGPADDDFLASAPCFRPLRPGRRYPAPWRAPR